MNKQKQKELIKHLMKKEKIGRLEAIKWIEKRDKYLNTIKKWNRG